MHYLLSIIPALLNNIMKSNVITVVHGVIQFPPTFIAQAKGWFYHTRVSYAGKSYRIDNICANTNFSIILPTIVVIILRFTH